MLMLDEERIALERLHRANPLIEALLREIRAAESACPSPILVLAEAVEKELGGRLTGSYPNPGVCGLNIGEK